MMKERAILLLAGSLLLPLPSQTTAQPKTPQVQFLQSATSVSYKDGMLTLKDAAPVTVFFSDRPERLTGHVRNDLFAKLWSEGKNSFKSDPPNAALSVFDPKGQPTQTIVVLSNPRLEGRNILYDARALKGDISRLREQKARCSSTVTTRHATRGEIIQPIRTTHAGRRPRFLTAGSEAPAGPRCGGQ